MVTPGMIVALTGAATSGYAVIVVDSIGGGAGDVEAFSPLLTQKRCRPARVVQPRCQKCNRLNPQGVSRCNWCGGRVK